MSTPTLFDLSGDRPRPFQSPVAKAKAKAAARQRRRKKIVEDFIQRNQPKQGPDGMFHLPSGGGVITVDGKLPSTDWSQPKFKKVEPRKKVELTDRQHRQVEAFLAFAAGRRDICGRPLDESGNIIEF